MRSTNNLQMLTIENYISPLDSVKKSSEKKSLGSVLSLVNSSHSPVLIYNSKDEFQGIVSPFRNIYSSNQPYTTVVSSIIFRPPNIKRTTSVFKVADHMLAKKIYTLPVFTNKDALEGVVQARRMLQGIIVNPEILELLKNKIRPRTPITAPINSTVRDVFNTLKEKGVSRIVLIDGGGALAGIITRSDLMHFMTKPTPKMRYRTEGSPGSFFSFAGEKKFRRDEPVRRFYTAKVFTLPDNAPMGKVITTLINSIYNSIVLVNKQNRPTGFISVRDILRAVSRLRPEKEIPVLIKTPSKCVSPGELEQARRLLTVLALKLNKKVEIDRIEVTTEEPKNPKGQTLVFNTTVIAFPTNEKSIVATTKQRDFIKGIRTAITLIEKQQRRDN